MDTSTATPEGIATVADDTGSEDIAMPPAAVAPGACAPAGEDGAPSLEGTALEAWRSYLQSHATIVRMLDAELISEHGITTRDYEVLLYLAQADGHRLPMSALAESTMLTRSGITRLVDGLVAGGFIERVSCPKDARVSYAQLTDDGLRQASRRRSNARGQHPPAVPRTLRRDRDRTARGDARQAARRPARRLL